MCEEKKIPQEENLDSDGCSGDDCPCKDDEIVGLPDGEELHIHPPAPRFERVLPRLTKDDGTKLGRNDPCPCKSGKKFKNCCIELT